MAVFDTKIDDRISQVSYTHYKTFENISDSEIKALRQRLIWMQLGYGYTYQDAKNKTDAANQSKALNFVQQPNTSANKEERTMNMWVDLA